MLAAMAASLLFTFIYATAAAKSRRAELVLVPVLDILQSVPVLGYISFTVTFFLALFPGSVLGAECAAIFAIFTSQAWNMAFSFYQSLRTVPRDLDEVSAQLPLHRLAAVLAAGGALRHAGPDLEHDDVACPAAGSSSSPRRPSPWAATPSRLPGVGSYVALAIEQRRSGRRRLGAC